MPGTFAARHALTPLLLLATAGCALFDRSPPVNVQPVESSLQQAISLDDALYNSAVRAISVRDYATALDYLQAARQKKSDDIRVLNAFGVVYDKLGRFDLSARYYAEAQMLDPMSRIVAANLAWSARLRETAASGIPSEIALAPVAPPLPDTGEMEMGALAMEAGPTTTATVVPAAAPRIVTGWTAPPARNALSKLTPPARAAHFAAPPAPRPVSGTAGVSPVPLALVLTSTKKPVLTGHPLVIINASGQNGASEPVRHNLASRGWTAPRSAMSEGPQQTVTTINFASANETAAHALARTLPFPSHLVLCDNRCAGLRLVIGHDFLKARPSKALPAVKRV